MISPEALLFVEEAAIEEELLAKARHDLRNRLAVIRGSAFYLRRRVEVTELWGADARVAQFFAQVESEVDTATTILTEGLTVSRPITRRIEDVDVAECVRWAVERARFAEPGKVRVELDVVSSFVRAEAAELCVAVRCLVENAAEAMSDGGVVRIVGKIEGREIAVDVRDEGAGFGDGGVEQAMEAFFSTRDGRRGLGLNIAQRICRRHGGRLDVRSLAQGVGARMSFPLAGGPSVDALAGG